jgi:hypothetical protein
LNSEPTPSNPIPRWNQPPPKKTGDPQVARVLHPDAGNPRSKITPANHDYRRPERRPYTPRPTKPNPNNPSVAPPSGTEVGKILVVTNKLVSKLRGPLEDLRDAIPELIPSSANVVLFQVIVEITGPD